MLIRLFFFGVRDIFLTQETLNLEIPRKCIDPVCGFGGMAWCLFDDEVSVQRALDVYHRGDANIYGMSLSRPPSLVIRNPFDSALSPLPPFTQLAE